jgi:O-methyltransferase
MKQERISRKQRDPEYLERWIQELEHSGNFTDVYNIEEESWIIEAIKRNLPYTSTEPAAMYDLAKAVNHVVTAKIPGDAVECGVFMGGSSRLMMDVFKHHGLQRSVWMYDTFEGVPVPHYTELTHDNQNLQEWFKANHLTLKGSTWCYCSIDDVKENIDSLGYKGAVNYVKGKVENTIPNTMPDQISILRIDVDLEHPTRHILEELYERVSPGGHIIFDDYGYFPNVRKTVDDFFQGKVFLSRVTKTVRHAIKP